MRASSFYENESCLKTNDYIAPKLLPKKILPLARIKRINKYNEAWRFGIEKGHIDTFMEELGLKLLKSSSAKDLEDEYHFGPHRINGTHFMTVAETH